MEASSLVSSLMARTLNMERHKGEAFNYLFNCTLLNGSSFNFVCNLSALNGLSFLLSVTLKGDDATFEVTAYQDGEPSAERQ